MRTAHRSDVGSRRPSRRLGGRAVAFLAVALLAVGISHLSAQPTPPPGTPGTPGTPGAAGAAAQTTPAPAQPAPNQAQAPVYTAPPAPAPAPTDGMAGNLGDLSTQPVYKLKEMFMFSPMINGIIFGLSILSLMFFIYFLLTINSRAAAPPAFVNEITNLVLVKRYSAAADACRRSQKVFIAPIVLRCVENAGRSHSIILDMIDSEGRRLSDVIWNRISYLSDISNVAPMFGLLGTVVGMLTAFFGLERESGSIDAAVLSQGVGQSMTTTMFGLVAGITALVFYSIIKTRATKTLAEAEAAVHSIADRIRAAAADEDDEHPSSDEPSKVF